VWNWKYHRYSNCKYEFKLITWRKPTCVRLCPLNNWPWFLLVHMENDTWIGNWRCLNLNGRLDWIIGIRGNRIYPHVLVWRAIPCVFTLHWFVSYEMSCGCDYLKYSNLLKRNELLLNCNWFLRNRNVFRLKRIKFCLKNSVHIRTRY